MRCTLEGVLRTMLCHQPHGLERQRNQNGSLIPGRWCVTHTGPRSRDAEPVLSFWLRTGSAGYQFDPIWTRGPRVFAPVPG